MADLSVLGGSVAAAEDTDAIHTALQHPLGTLAVDGAGNVYIYLQGVASTVATDWVTYDEAHLTTRAAANAIGPLAVAMAAVVANNYGWYQVKGSAQANVATSFADNGAVYLTATAGRVDDADVVGDAVIGAWGRGAESSNVATVQLDWPKVHNIAID